MKWKSIVPAAAGLTAGGLGVFGFSICCLPVAAGFAGALGIVAIFSYKHASWLMIAGIILLGISGCMFWRNRRRISHYSILTCPKCGFVKQEAMPNNACVYFYECSQCHTQLKPKEGDCCVFCSYGDVPCPPKQHDCQCSTKEGKQ